jgi:hypothetical protein
MISVIIEGHQAVLSFGGIESVNEDVDPSLLKSVLISCGGSRISLGSMEIRV